MFLILNVLFFSATFRFACHYALPPLGCNDSGKGAIFLRPYDRATSSSSYIFSCAEETTFSNNSALVFLSQNSMTSVINHVRMSCFLFSLFKDFLKFVLNYLGALFITMDARSSTSVKSHSVNHFLVDTLFICER